MKDAAKSRSAARICKHRPEKTGTAAAFRFVFDSLFKFGLNAHKAHRRFSVLVCNSCALFLERTRDPASLLTPGLKRDTTTMARSLLQMLDLPAAPTAEPLALLVGLAADDVPAGAAPLTSARLESLPFILLHAALAMAPWVRCVVSPLVNEQFDAMDLALELDAAAYRGHYFIMAPPLPRPDIIRRELRQIAPQVEIDLLPRVWH